MTNPTDTPAPPVVDADRSAPTTPAPGASPPLEDAAPGLPPSAAGGGRHHTPERGTARPPLTPLEHGKFRRMFDLPPLVVTGEQAAAVADVMREQVVDAGSGGSGWAPTPTPSLDNDALPSAYTYLGQFLAHDTSFDAASSHDRQRDPDALVNFRTPRLDLDSLYGSGPQDQPYLYEDDGLRLLVTPNRNGERDLPRNVLGRALIGDPRNDEDMIVSQLHLAFADAHNRLVVELQQGAYPDARRAHGPQDVFEEAQRLLRWHYQYVVATDFLRRVCGGITQVLLASPGTGPDGRPAWEGALRLTPPPGGALRYRPTRNRPAWLPLEFSGAAYRYGHSQPRPGYLLNDGRLRLTEDKAGLVEPYVEATGVQGLV